MNRKIPYRLWPGLGLVVIWFSPLLFVVYRKEVVDAELQHSNSPVTVTLWIIVFTIASGFSLLLHLEGGKQRRSMMSRWSIVVRMLAVFLAVFISSAIAMQFPLSNIRKGSFRSTKRSAIQIKEREFWMEYLQEDYSRRQLRKIPVGVSEFQNLSTELREEMFWLARDEGLDGWGNPFMIVREERENQTWVGMFSYGQDGVSSSSGNDLDDLNTWGRDGDTFYFTNRDKPKGELFRISLIAFLFFLPICFLTFRKPHFPDNQTA